MKRNLAWHFIKGNKLRDGSPIPKDGKWLTFNGPLKLCESGLHWSREPFDALRYAPGDTLCLVEYGGKVIMDYDKGVCSRRRIIARMYATEMLYYFARQQAISVLDKWDTEPPQIVLDYLMGDDVVRDAARDTAWAAARDAARDTAWAAARDAARDAALAAARDAARDAALAAAWAAARATALAAAWAAARATALDAARAAQRKEFNSLVYECFEKFL